MPRSGHDPEHGSHRHTGIRTTSLYAYMKNKYKWKKINRQSNGERSLTNDSPRRRKKGRFFFLIADSKVTHCS